MKNAVAISIPGGSTNIKFAKCEMKLEFQISGLSKNVKRLKAVNKSLF